MTEHTPNDPAAQKVMDAIRSARVRRDRNIQTMETRLAMLWGVITVATFAILIMPLVMR